MKKAEKSTITSLFFLLAIIVTSGGPIPHNMAKAFDGPPTLERSGSEPPEGGYILSSLREERLGEKGGAFFNGKEGRDDFRKSYYKNKN